MDKELGCPNCLCYSCEVHYEMCKGNCKTNAEIDKGEKCTVRTECEDYKR